MKKAKVIIFFIVLIVLEIVSYAVGVAFQVLSDYTSQGIEISQIPFAEEYLVYLLNIPNTFGKLINTPNPIFIMCAIASVVGAFMMARTAKESGYQIQPQYAVHGGSRWARHDEITVKNQINHCKESEIFKFLLSSIGSEIDED